MFTREKPDVGHLNIFNCPVYIHVSKYKMTNMETSRKKGTFIVYSESSKHYRIYVLGKGHIQVSRAITFHEEVVCIWSKYLMCDLYMEVHDTPMMEDLVYGYHISYVERENP